MTIGFRTLDVGQQALVYNLPGEARIEEGPKRLFLKREKFVLLTRYCATQNQYLKVTYKNGKVEHVTGPATIFKNPLEHESISVQEGTALDANEVIVVYECSSTDAVRRYIKHGPSLFIPKASEWLHMFCWHGTDPQNKTRKIPRSLTFSKLQVIPDQFYYNVDQVRTSDDALIRVKLMMFYELSNIEHMIDATQDPIADFINCLEADVVAFAAKLTYMEFIDQSSKLNDLASYPQLQERCGCIGYTVSKVVFRGYYTSPTLQGMHDNAIQTRMRIKIATETEEQEQEFTDINLQKEMERHKIEQSMEIEAMKHKLNMERIAKQHELKLGEEQHAETVAMERALNSAHLLARRAQLDAQIAHLRALKEGVSVDVGRYVLSQSRRPEKIVRVVGEQANFHLHQSA